VKDVGEPGAGEPHARFDGGELEKEPAMAADHGGPRETEGPEPGIAYKQVTSPAPYPTNLLTATHQDYADKTVLSSALTSQDSQAGHITPPST
jgi:hypothetical protein